jgi:hypothetical protein
LTFLSGDVLVINAGSMLAYRVAGSYAVNSARATHVKIAPASGTFSGAYRVSPQRGF